MPMRSIGHLLCTAIFLAFIGPANAEQTNVTLVPLQPVFRMKADGPKHPLSTRMQYGFSESNSVGIAWHAVVTNTWFPGLVPIFGLAKARSFELRRHPPSGQENITEPLFFALPRPDESEAHLISGKWTVDAVRSTGSKAFLGWEFAVDGDGLEGRFDQEGEYRFGFITGGTFASNRVEIQVEYYDDRYLLTGNLAGERFTGTYRHLTADETGTWEAWRELPHVKPSGSHEVVALYEWTRSSDQARAYYNEGTRPEGDWVRAPRPLCQVWQPAQ